MDYSRDISKIIKQFRDRITQASYLIEIGNFDESIPQLEKIQREAWQYNIPQISTFVEKTLNNAQILKNLVKMFKVSSKLKIDDICMQLKCSREELLKIIFDWGEKFEANIDGDFILVNNTEPSMNSTIYKKFKIYISLGDLLFENKEYTEASEQYNKAIDIAKNDINDSDLIIKTKNLYEKTQNMIIEEGNRNKELVDNGKEAFINGEYENSIEYFDRSKEICKRLGWKDGIRYADEIIGKCIEMNKSGSYHGTILLKHEYNFMMELENRIGMSIPVLSENKINYDTFGFFASNNQVTGLGIYGKNLSSIPESIGSLTSLKELYLSNNRLTFLPESIGSLISLKELYLSNNQLTSLPESIDSLKSLTFLVLTSNQITNLSDNIGSLKSLAYINLGYNKLSSLPESIGLLSSLEILALCQNQLSHLPKSIGSLVLLKLLDLSNNYLTYLPENTRIQLKTLEKNGCSILLN